MLPCAIRRDTLKWYVLYTRHHHDRTVRDRLSHNGFEVFQPLVKVWRRSNRVSWEANLPLFPRRLFVHCYLEMYAHLELISTPGVLHLLEDFHGRLLVVADEEIRTLRQIGIAGVPFERAPYHIQGNRVQVVQGPLRGVASVVREGSQTTLFVPINALRESVAVQTGLEQFTACEDVREGTAPSDPLDGS